MSAWWQGPLLAADTETTGVDLENDRIVTATVIEIVPGRQTETFDWLINPGIEIPAEATAVHGITTEEVRAKGVDPFTAIGDIHARLANSWARGIPVIAYNGCFDFTILDREMRRHGHGILVPGPVIDPLVIDKKVDRYRKGSRKLIDTCAHLGIMLSEEDAHSSAADALAAARVAWKLAARHPLIGGTSLEELQTLQAAWYAEQQTSFAQYLRRIASVEQDADKRAETIARADAISVDWPVRRCPGELETAIA